MHIRIDIYNLLLRPTQYLSYAYTFHDYYVLLTSRNIYTHNLQKRRPPLVGKVSINGISEHAP